jgi:hypothetical protein
MIRAERGVLLEQVDEAGLVETGSGHRVEVVVAPPAPATGDRVVIATTTTRVGAHRLTFSVLLGRDGDQDDPAGIEGLRHTPVVLCADEHVGLVLAGARRAGTAPVSLDTPADPGLGLLRLASSGAEVIVWVVPGGAALDLVRTLAGRPIPVLPLPDHDRLRRRFLGARTDANVPVPTTEGPARQTVWDPIRALSLDERHHLVEVDPRPAFVELGDDPRAASLEQLAAGAAGVLAARLAVGDRRWREIATES